MRRYIAIAVAAAFPLLGAGCSYKGLTERYSETGKRIEVSYTTLQAATLNEDGFEKNETEGGNWFSTTSKTDSSVVAVPFLNAAGNVAGFMLQGQGGPGIAPVAPTGFNAQGGFTAEQMSDVTAEVVKSRDSAEELAAKVAELEGRLAAAEAAAEGGHE